ncbi:hypothetical protein Nepgr_026201 [Nepenthes gracilis]|uniref:GDPGP1-like C-terminal domain-containing protein n=1 Tax=Nepenthes gracilis TaxID=150966 RepID=A0AAD3Y0D0_NEPGR|nr:hypothetical protein Nepgr_026201 [Nepenthes gracilis]
MDQAYYLALRFPIEKACTLKLTNTVSGMKISELLNYPVWGFTFEGGNFLQDFSEAISGSCICLQDNNIPYNVLISDSGKRVFIIPQCYAEKQALGEVDHELLDTQVNPAAWEISGHIGVGEEGLRGGIRGECMEAPSRGVSFQSKGELTPEPLEAEADIEKSLLSAIVSGKQECMVQL